MTAKDDGTVHAGADSENQPPSFEHDWPWLLLMWWFFGLLAYHLFLEHRAHVLGAWPYVVAVALLPILYLASRRRRDRRHHRPASS